MSDLYVVEGTRYLVFRESSGNRGTYPQWTHAWARLEAAVLADSLGEDCMKCGSRYVQDNKWTRLPDDCSIEEGIRQCAEKIERKSYWKPHTGPYTHVVLPLGSRYVPETESMPPLVELLSKDTLKKLA